MTKENIYMVGAFVAAAEAPARMLVIHQYYRRIYYCAVADNPAHKHFVYFGHELIPAEMSSKKS
jgi:hypothetical protein